MPDVSTRHLIERDLEHEIMPELHVAPVAILIAGIVSALIGAICLKYDEDLKSRPRLR